jgi:hypothetical protein
MRTLGSIPVRVTPGFMGVLDRDELHELAAYPRATSVEGAYLVPVAEVSEIPWHA